MKREIRETRKHPRYTKILNIDCKALRFPDDIMGEKSKIKEGGTFRATTINVSQTGVLINCDFILPERTTIEITVSDPAITKKPITLKTRIAWTKRNAYKIFGRYAAGLHIEEGNKGDIDMLVEHFN
ncbi:MAG TPA: PilZ domain-containing protein [bacterium]|nr:PilZ domain-containing protein [bacterium]